MGALLADSGCTRFAIEIRTHSGGRAVLRRYPLAQTRAIEALQRQFGRYLWVAGVSKADGSRRVFVRRGCREAGGVPHHSRRLTTPEGGAHRALLSQALWEAAYHTYIHTYVIGRGEGGGGRRTITKNPPSRMIGNPHHQRGTETKVYTG